MPGLYNQNIISSVKKKGGGVKCSKTFDLYNGDMLVFSWQHTYSSELNITDETLWITSEEYEKSLS